MSGCRTAWVPVSRAATFTGRPTRTVRQWADDLRIRSRCRVSDHRVEVWFFDVLDVAGVQPTRKRAA